MRTAQYALTLLSCTVALLLSGCAPTVIYDAGKNPPAITGDHALALYALRNAYAASFDPVLHKVVYDKLLTSIGPDSAIFDSGTGHRCPYSTTPEPRVVDILVIGMHNDVNVKLACDNGETFAVYFGEFGSSTATAFARAWYLVAHTPVSDPAADARFTDLAAQYRAAPEKFALPESLREYKVVAETAVREKRMADAADAYEQALRQFPAWPQGQFNVALIYGELQAYEAAISRMQRYLALLPDAANARQAQDRIYEWKHRITPPSRP